MNAGIPGFTDLQRDLADRIWSLDSQQEVNEFVMTLPKNLKREAWVVMTMIIWSELDQYMEVDPSVTDYINTLS